MGTLIYSLTPETAQAQPKQVGASPGQLQPKQSLFSVSFRIRSEGQGKIRMKQLMIGNEAVAWGACKAA